MENTAQVDMNIAPSQITFSQVPIGSFFYHKGMIWRKRSNRTAHIACLPNKWEHFSGKTFVE